jgi:hypothetical protein
MDQSNVVAFIVDSVMWWPGLWFYAGRLEVVLWSGDTVDDEQ